MMTKCRRYRGFLIAAVLLGLSVTTVPVRSSADGIPVRVAQARVEKLEASRATFGTVVSRKRAAVAAEVAGRLVRVVELGTAVEKGEILARVDTKRLDIASEEAIARVERVRSRLEHAEANLDRLRSLAGSKNIAAAEFEAARAEHDALTHRLAEANAQLSRVRHRLTNAIIRAPFDGIVVERLARKGEWADAGTPLVRFVDPRAREVVTRVPVDGLSRLEPGTDVLLDTGQGSYSATIKHVAPPSVPGSRHVSIRVAYDGPRAIGEAIRVQLPVERARLAVTVPRDALVIRGEGLSVFRINNKGQAERITVEVGSSAGEWIAVEGGIAAGDSVVVRGAERLESGQVVRILGRL